MAGFKAEITDLNDKKQMVYELFLDKNKTMIWISQKLHKGFLFYIFKILYQYWTSPKVRQIVTNSKLWLVLPAIVMKYIIDINIC